MPFNPATPPEKFAFTKNKRNPKVVIVASHASAQTQGNTDTFNADQMLAQRLHQLMSKAFKENRDKVEIISPYKVQDYLAKNPQWKDTLDPTQIGKHFDADYVMFLEISRLSLYKERSNHLFYEGNAEIQVTVVDVANAEAGTEVSDVYVCTYPSSGPVPADYGPGKFRTQFINKMARDLTFWFASHPSENKHDLD